MLTCTEKTSHYEIEHVELGAHYTVTSVEQLMCVCVCKQVVLCNKQQM